MPKGQSRLILNFLKAGCPCFLVLFICSCTIVKKYPHGKPFVYRTNINLIGNLTNEEKTTLNSRLIAQLDDSMRSRSVSKVFWNVMKSPPVYDTVNAEKSTLYMGALLTALGYFRDTITYRASIDSSRGDKYRTTVTFDVKPGVATRIDSFSYNINHPELQKLAVVHQTDALVKEGDPFAKANISSELDRLVTLYRENGYMRITREELVGLWDTLDISLLEPTLDPLEQIELLEKLKARRKNPTANLEINLRSGYDSSKIKKFYIGNITVYPDITLDTTNLRSTVTMAGNVKVIAYRNIFKPKIFPQNIYLHYKDLYDQRNYFKTINRFNSLGPWRLVNIVQLPRRDKDTADFTIHLTPAKKYSFFTNLEGSRNQNAVSGNLFGIAVNIGLQNRNFAKAANQANTNFRFGIETGRDTATRVKFIQTRQISVTHTIYFPRPIPNMKNWFPEKVRNSFRTVLSLNTAITERRELYNLKSANASWGYNFTWGKKQWAIRIPNFEYSLLDSKPKLDTIFFYNPTLRNVFTDGIIASTIAAVNIPGSWKKNINHLRVNAEVCGLLLGFVRNSFLDSNLYRFIKVDVDFAQKIAIRNRSVLVFHFFAGIGNEFNSTANKRRSYNLPFFREYFAGGPNSMRAWGLRKLGPGSTIKSFGIDGSPDRYGDVQLETNLEYRFPFIKPFGIDINAALFTDIGNIWYLKSAPGRPSEEVFSFSSLFNDLAVGVGAGMRIDFRFFVIRLDYSIKAKDPSPSPNNAAVQNKWFGYKKLSEMDQFQLAISYPFIL